MRPGEDLLGAHHRAEVRQPPRVRVEHRHDREQHVAVGAPERRGKRLAEGVQHLAPVRVEHPLGLARGARGVAHRRRRVLVEHRPVVAQGRALRDHVLEVERARGQRAAGVADHDDMLDGRRGAELLEEGPEHVVDDDRAITGVRRDVTEIFGTQADVERVADHPRAGNGIVRFEVLRMVPGERSHTIARLEPERREPCRKVARPLDDVAIGGAVNGPVRPPAGDLDVGVDLLGATHQRRQREREIHHQTAHESLVGGGSRNARGLGAGCARSYRPRGPRQDGAAIPRCAPDGAATDLPGRARCRATTGPSGRAPRGTAPPRRAAPLPRRP